MQRSKPQISPGELMEAIFTVPRRLEEEPKLKRNELGANRRRIPYQKPISKPLEDLSTYSTDFPMKVIVGSKGILSMLMLSLFSKFKLSVHFITSILCINLCPSAFCYFYIYNLLHLHIQLSLLLYYTFTV
jgi:hypothetical protein